MGGGNENTPWGNQSFGRLVGKVLLKLCSGERYQQCKFYICFLGEERGMKRGKVLTLIFFLMITIAELEYLNDALDFLQIYFESFCRDYFSVGYDIVSGKKKFFPLLANHEQVSFLFFFIFVLLSFP